MNIARYIAPWIFLSILAPSIAAADIAVPDIPNKYQLPRLAADAYTGAVPKDADLAKLQAILSQPGVSREKLDAVELVRQMANRTPGPGETTRTTFKGYLDLLGQLMNKKEDPAFRRFAVASIFGPLYGAIRDNILVHSEEKPVWAAYTSINRIRLKGLKDKDLKLREFFGRYVQLKTDPKWRKIKALDQLMFSRLSADHPDKRPTLDKFWKQSQQIEDIQLAAATNNIHYIDGRKAVLNLRRRKKIVHAMQSLFTYHMYAIWGSLPQTINEEMGAGTAEKYGAQPLPVIMGWPNLSSIYKK